MKGQVANIVWKVTKKSTGLIILIAILTISGALFGLINPILYSRLIDNIIPSKDYKMLFVYLLLMVFIPCLITLLFSAKNYFSAKLGDKYTNDLRKECYNKVLGAKIEQFEKISSSQIVQRITKECGRIGEIYITKDIITFTTEFVTLISIIITMFILNINLSLLCVIAFPVAMAITFFVSKKSKNIDKEHITVMEEGVSYLNEATSSIKTIKVKNGEDTERQKWNTWLNKFRKIRLKSAVTHNINRFLMGDLIINSIYGIVFFYAGVLVINNRLSIGELVTFIAFVPRVYSSLRNVLNIKVSTNVISNSVEKINEILNIEQEKQGGMEIKALDTIEFKNVNFQYNRADFSVNDINLFFKKGDKVAIIGDSGSGKSTLFDLITMLYYPKEGEILINGIASSDVSISSVRNRLSIVTQSTDLFNGSIKNNITYPNLNTVNVDDILKITCLSEFTQRLPEKMDTDIGVGGDLISGGERQRICIANALLKESDVILLDEFTSALDVDIENKLINYILSTEKTVVMVSHRIYNVIGFDELIIMSGGKIAEVGEPKNLLKNKKSKFYEIYSKINMNSGVPPLA